jgi:hypothetical protein
MLPSVKEVAVQDPVPSHLHYFWGHVLAEELHCPANLEAVPGDLD